MAHPDQIAKYKRLQELRTKLLLLSEEQALADLAASKSKQVSQANSLTIPNSEQVQPYLQSQTTTCYVNSTNLTLNTDNPKEEQSASSKLSLQDMQFLLGMYDELNARFAALEEGYTTVLQKTIPLQHFAQDHLEMFAEYSKHGYAFAEAVALNSEEEFARMNYLEQIISERTVQEQTYKQLAQQQGDELISLLESSQEISAQELQQLWARLAPNSSFSAWKLLIDFYYLFSRGLEQQLQYIDFAEFCASTKSTDIEEYAVNILEIEMHRWLQLGQQTGSTSLANFLSSYCQQYLPYSQQILLALIQFNLFATSQEQVFTLVEQMLQQVETYRITDFKQLTSYLHSLSSEPSTKLNTKSTQDEVNSSSTPNLQLNTQHLSFYPPDVNGSSLVIDLSLPTALTIPDILDNSLLNAFLAFSGIDINSDDFNLEEYNANPYRYIAQIPLEVREANRHAFVKQNAMQHDYNAIKILANVQKIVAAAIVYRAVTKVYREQQISLQTYQNATIEQQSLALEQETMNNFLFQVQEIFKRYLAVNLNPEVPQDPQAMADFLDAEQQIAYREQQRQEYELAQAKKAARSKKATTPKLTASGKIDGRSTRSHVPLADNKEIPITARKEMKEVPLFNDADLEHFSANERQLTPRTIRALIKEKETQLKAAQVAIRETVSSEDTANQNSQYLQELISTQRQLHNTSTKFQQQIYEQNLQLKHSLEQQLAAEQEELAQATKELMTEQAKQNSTLMQQQVQQNVPLGQVEQIANITQELPNTSPQQQQPTHNLSQLLVNTLDQQQLATLFTQQQVAALIQQLNNVQVAQVNNPPTQQQLQALTAQQAALLVLQQNSLLGQQQTQKQEQTVSTLEQQANISDLQTVLLANHQATLTNSATTITNATENSVFKSQQPVSKLKKQVNKKAKQSLQTPPSVRNATTNTKATKTTKLKGAQLIKHLKRKAKPK